jgi:hypothetical protein
LLKVAKYETLSDTQLTGVLEDWGGGGNAGNKEENTPKIGALFINEFN